MPLLVSQGEGFYMDSTARNFKGLMLRAMLAALRIDSNFVLAGGPAVGNSSVVCLDVSKWGVEELE